MNVATNTGRVEAMTDPEQLEQIRRRTEMSLSWHRDHPDRIDARLRELDQEWDVERVLMTNATSLSLVGLSLALLSRKRWLLLPLVVQSFLLQHALQGWCPPLPVFRQLGFRTRNEIERERYGLKLLRGDFDPVRHGGNGQERVDTTALMEAVRP